MNAVTTDYATATYTGAGEFYSGIKTGDRVAVARTRYWATGTVSHSVQSLERPGPWLHVRRTARELRDVSAFGPDHPEWLEGTL